MASSSIRVFFVLCLAGRIVLRAIIGPPLAYSPLTKAAASLASFCIFDVREMTAHLRRVLKDLFVNERPPIAPHGGAQSIPLYSGALRN
jgi:hypothetical protein